MRVVDEGGSYYEYTYDAKNQLIRENNPRLNQTRLYTYDAGGNLTSMSAYALTTAATVSGTALFTETGTYDSTWKDKLVTYKKYNTSTSAYQNLAITYDGAGNMLKKGSTTYTWSRGRHLSAVSNGKSIQYQYDHTGLRTKKTVDGTVTEYRLAGSLLLSEKTGSETIRYAYDSHANPVAMAIGSTPYFYVRNAQNDITGLVDSTGTQVVKYSYDSWGNCTVSGSQASGAGAKNPFRYRGYYFDRETGLYYLKNRYYDPEVKRFLSPDTPEVLTAAPMALSDKNLYAYCDNNPVARRDGSGRIWETVFDLISLGSSIVEVAINPTDPWAWAGLIGDAVDLIPVVSGIGETVRTVEASSKLIKNTDNVIDAAKSLRRSTSTTSNLRIATGSYEIEYLSGKVYFGKGGFQRAIDSATRYANPHALNGGKGDTVIAIRWKSAGNERQAFIDEYYMQKKFGGVLNELPDLQTYNRIWSPGKKYSNAITF